MPIFFAGNAGRVVQVPDAGAAGVFRLMSMEPTVDFLIHRSIVTRVTLSEQTNTQFLHALGNSIYVYAFGDRLGQMQVSGLSFAADCVGAAFEHGAARVLRWYRDNRVANRPAPLRLTIGTVPLDGFAVQFSQDTVDPGMQLVSWNLGLATIPDG